MQIRTLLVSVPEKLILRVWHSISRTLSMLPRRRVLAVGGGVAAAGLAGCTSILDLADGFARRSVSVLSVTEPTDYPVAVSVAVAEPAVTTEHTARIEVTLENTGSSESPALGNKDLHQLHSVAPAGIGLVSAELEQPEPTGGCWATEQGGGPWDGSAGRPGIKLGPGEVLTRTYSVWDTLPEANPCMPPGDYSFEEGASTADPPLDWGLTLAITRPK